MTARKPGALQIIPNTLHLANLNLGRVSTLYKTFQVFFSYHHTPVAVMHIRHNSKHIWKMDISFVTLKFRWFFAV
jgi:hypothetical protein